MRNSIVLGIAMSIAAVNLPGLAESHDDVAQLKQRVDQLEKQVQEMSKVIEPIKAQQALEQRRKELHVKFEQRLKQDENKYSNEQLGEAEKLYQVANQKWGTPEATESLQKMVKQYPDVNRTGCAMLYLAQTSKGAEQIEKLKECVDKYGDCMYGDGVQVGAFARYLLVQAHKSGDDEEKAEALENEIRTKFPDAVDHGGNLLVDDLKDDSK